MVLAFQQIVRDTFDGVLDRWNSPRRWWRYWSFARSRGDFTLHNEHLVFPAIFFIAPKAQDQMAKPPGISMQEWTEEPLFGTKHSGYAETEGRTGFRISIDLWIDAATEEPSGGTNLTFPRYLLSLPSGTAQPFPRKHE